jgi:hypothetical protein
MPPASPARSPHARLVASPTWGSRRQATSLPPASRARSPHARLVASPTWGSRHQATTMPPASRAHSPHARLVASPTWGSRRQAPPCRPLRGLVRRTHASSRPRPGAHTTRLPRCRPLRGLVRRTHASSRPRFKRVIVTGMKNEVRFIQYAIDVVRAKLRGERLPLPLAATPWLRPRIPANRGPVSTGSSPGTLSTLMTRASKARPPPSTGSGPRHRIHLPDLPDHPSIASPT